jgi:O-acetyl-ADP-ribose deacetylase
MAFRILGTRVEWLPEAERPATGDVLVIPGNDRLWMLSGPGLELKKIHGKEIEAEAVRLGPLDAGRVAVTSGAACGYRWLHHAVVMGQDHAWIEGAGRAAARESINLARRASAAEVVFYPLYRGIHGRREQPAKDMLEGFFDGLGEPSKIKTIFVLFQGAEEKALLHETFLQLLSAPPM